MGLEQLTLTVSQYVNSAIDATGVAPRERGARLAQSLAVHRQGNLADAAWERWEIQGRQARVETAAEAIATTGYGPLLDRCVEVATAYLSGLEDR